MDIEENRDGHFDIRRIARPVRSEEKCQPILSEAFEKLYVQAPSLIPMPNPVAVTLK